MSPASRVARGDSEFIALVRAIVDGDAATVSRLLAASSQLASARAEQGAYLDQIEHHLYAGDTALHIAAASYRHDLARRLVGAGAEPSARNRRGAQPLHYAADGVPGCAGWNPHAQAATVTYLIEAGADPNALDKSGVAPLHRAVRTRCAAAVAALLDGGADAERKNKRGSTPLKLAVLNTGRGGSGSPEARAQQQEIVRMLEHRARRPLLRR
jgi:ankyrin repeat protein